MIVHITTRAKWEQALAIGSYHAETLDTEGFIHCSKPDQVIRVANLLFRGQTELVLLCIDSSKLTSRLRYEPPLDGRSDEQFPHLYGPLNLDAVNIVLDFPPGADGAFVLPEGVSQLSGPHES